MIDILPSLREFMVTNGEISALVEDRIIAFEFETIEGENSINPKICYKSEGGNKGMQRYKFIVRSDGLLEARNIAKVVCEEFTEKTFSLGKNISIEWVEQSSNFFDLRVKGTNEFETFFYLNFHIT